MVAEQHWPQQTPEISLTFCGKCCRIITWTHTETPLFLPFCVCVCIHTHSAAGFSLPRPVQMHGLPFLFVVTSISQMSLALCWLLTLLSPSLFLLLPVSLSITQFLYSFSMSLSLCPLSRLSPFCLSLLLTLPSLSVSQLCGSCRSSSCLMYPSAACRALTFTYSYGKGTRHLLTAFSSRAPRRLFVIFDHNWIISLTVLVLFVILESHAGYLLGCQCSR